MKKDRFVSVNINDVVTHYNLKPSNMNSMLLMRYIRKYLKEVYGVNEFYPIYGRSSI